MNHHRPHSFPQNPHMEQPHDPYGRNLTTGNHDLIRPTGDPGVFSENTPSGITRAWDRPTPPDNGPIRQVHAPIDPAFQERFGVSIAQSRPNSANTPVAPTRPEAKKINPNMLREVRTSETFEDEEQIDPRDRAVLGIGWDEYMDNGRQGGVKTFASRFKNGHLLTHEYDAQYEREPELMVPAVPWAIVGLMGNRSFARCGDLPQYDPNKKEFTSEEMSGQKYLQKLSDKYGTQDIGPSLIQIKRGDEEPWTVLSLGVDAGSGASRGMFAFAARGYQSVEQMLERARINFPVPFQKLNLLERVQGHEARTTHVALIPEEVDAPESQSPANMPVPQAQSRPEFLARSGQLFNLPAHQHPASRPPHPRAAGFSPHNATLGPTAMVRGQLERLGRPMPPQSQRLGYAPVRHAVQVQYPGQQMPGFVRPNRAPYQIQPMHGQQPLPETMMQPPTREMRRPEIVTDQENIDVTDRPVILQGNRRMLGGYGGGMDTYVANPKSGSLVERSMGWAQSLSDLPNGRENAILPRNVKELLEDRQFGILGEVPPYNERDNVFGALNPETRRRFYDDAEERLRQEGVTDFSPSLVQIEQNGKSWTVLCLGKDFTHDGRGMLSFAVAGNQNVDQMFQRARHAIPKVFESLPGAPIRQEATRVQHIVLPPRSE